MELWQLTELYSPKVVPSVFWTKNTLESWKMKIALLTVQVLCVSFVKLYTDLKVALTLNFI